MLRIWFEWLEFAFECFESLSNGLILQSIASNPFWMVQICIRMLRILSNCSNLYSNPFRMVRICIRMLQILFEEFEFAFKCFEFWSNGSNLHLNASNPFQICNRMLKILFELFEFAFECFESLSNGSNLHSKASNPFEWFEFGCECFESLSNGSNLHSNPFQMVRICIRILRISFEGFDFAFECFKFVQWFRFSFECFEPLLNGSNLDANASTPFQMVWILHSNPFRMVQIYIQKLRIPFKRFKFGCECFESLSNGSNLDSNASNAFRMVRICI